MDQTIAEADADEDGKIGLEEFAQVRVTHDPHAAVCSNLLSGAVSHRYGQPYDNSILIPLLSNEFKGICVNSLLINCWFCIIKI